MTLTFKQFITEALSITSLIKVFVDLLPTDIKAHRHKRAGTAEHLRLTSSKSIAELFADFPVTIELSDKREASGTYDTYVITLEKPFKGGEEGDSFLVVNTKKENSKISKKLLTPAKLKLEGDKIDISKFVKTVEDALKSEVSDKLNDDEIDYLVELVKKSSTTKETFTLEPPSSLSKADLDQIAIDFGEIFGVMWSAKNLFDEGKADKVLFPSGANPLIDYTIFKEDESIDVSAKSKKGAPPSINAINDIIQSEDNNFKKFDEDKLNVIDAIINNSVIGGILEANKLLETDGIKILQKLLKKSTINDIKLADISKYMDTLTLDNCEDTLSDLFDACGSRASTKLITRIFNGNDKKDGIILSPLGYHVVRVMNSDDELSDILNKAAKLIKATQLYSDINDSKVSFKIKKFEEAKFVWHYNSNAGQPSLKKISFKMES